MTLSKSNILAGVVLFIAGALVAQLFLDKIQQKTTTKDKDVKIITIVEDKKKDGSSHTVTVIHDTRTVVKKETLTIPVRKTTNISALVANDFSKRLIEPVYGLSVSKEVLGPITVGVFGFTNTTVGVSVGISF